MSGCYGTIGGREQAIRAPAVRLRFAWNDRLMDSVKQEVRFTDKHLGRSAEVMAGG